MPDFIDRMTELMRLRGLVPKDVFQGVNVSQPTFSDWVTRKTNVSVANRLKIAKFLNTSLEYMETGRRRREYPTALKVQSIENLTAFAIALDKAQVNPGLKTLAANAKMTKETAIEQFNELEDSRFANVDDRTATYVWTLDNDTMTAPTGESWPNGAQIAFHPHKKPLQGHCIMVIMDGRLCFRRWVEVDGVQILTLLNPAYSQGTAIHYNGNIWDIWVGTPIGYTQFTAP
ncbi:helix-turn-helix transcriptional regulator [Candidatus Sororendozoicomonas aggregata]|uniref:helix-turn-helix domain-containing protein n=1 Tax=Candidatus Sororendozoicomonas aggregata TaxID=3073239 RepID=UPI002ED29266